jgi:hypothetical protein
MHSRFTPFFTGFLFVVYASASLAASRALDDDMALPDFGALARESNNLGAPGGGGVPLLRDARAEIALPGVEHVEKAPLIAKQPIEGKPDPRPQVLPADPRGFAGGKPNVLPRPEVLPADPHQFAGGKPDLGPQVLPADPQAFVRNNKANVLLRPQVQPRAVVENNAGVAEDRGVDAVNRPLVRAAIKDAVALPRPVQAQLRERVDMQPVVQRNVQKRGANWQRWAQKNPPKCVFDCGTKGDQLARNLGVDKDVADLKAKSDSAQNAAKKVSKLVK